ARSGMPGRWPRRARPAGRLRARTGSDRPRIPTDPGPARTTSARPRPERAEGPRPDRRAERLERGLGSLGVDLDDAASIAHPAGDPVAGGEPPHERTKAHPLHDA